MGSPFLRWAGGKRWLAPVVAECLKGFDFERYIEPFLGGGAMFFELEPRESLLNDLNHELVGAYRMIKHHPHDIRNRLSKLPVSRKAYYQIRAKVPLGVVDRAVRFIYLNRTCYRGLHRVNRMGLFNVPYGGGDRTPHLLVNSDALAKASKLLKNARLTASDFSVAFRNARKGDLIFCDPTYTGRIYSDRFIRYNDKVFSWEDQVRLAEECNAARTRGINVIVSNVCSEEVARLYDFAIQCKVSCPSRIGSLSYRGAIEEFVFFAGKELCAHLKRSQNGLINVA